MGAKKRWIVLGLFVATAPLALVRWELHAPVEVERPVEHVAARRAPPIAAVLAPARTSLVVVQLGSTPTLVAWCEKPFAWHAPDSGSGSFRVEDAATGALLAEGACDLPEGCPCPAGHDHASGDVVFDHDPVVRMKLPRQAARERVTLLAHGSAVATFLLEATP